LDFCGSRKIGNVPSVPELPGIRNGSAPRDGKAAPHIGAARTQPTAKEKTPRTPTRTRVLARPSPAPRSLALAAQEGNQQLLCQDALHARRIASPGRLRTPTVGIPLAGQITRCFLSGKRSGFTLENRAALWSDHPSKPSALLFPLLGMFTHIRIESF